MSNKESDFDPRRRNYSIRAAKRGSSQVEFPEIPEKSLLQVFKDSIIAKINQIAMRISLRGGNPDHARVMKAVKRNNN
jgi:hypothetical protein